MCLALYIASPKPLPTVPWDPVNPAFHVVDLPEDALDVRKHFHAEHVYYAGSRQGCSCAFNYEHEYEAILQLRDYLRTALTSVDEIEVFVCELGSDDQEIKHFLITSPEGIALPEFFFKDGHFLLIGSAKSLQARRRSGPQSRPQKSVARGS